MTRPREILTIAEALAKHGSPAAIRSAISRAYYSIFHHVGQRPDPTNYNGQHGGSVHSSLQELLIGQPMACDPDIAAARDVFQSMRLMRGKADYELDESISPMQAEIAVKRAKVIFEADGQ